MNVHSGCFFLFLQRGIYPPETFSRVEKYGLTVLVSTDDMLKQYLDAVTVQLKDWLLKKTVQRLVVVIKVGGQRMR